MKSFLVGLIAAAAMIAASLMVLGQIDVSTVRDTSRPSLALGDHLR